MYRADRAEGQMDSRATRAGDQMDSRDAIRWISELSELGIRWIAEMPEPDEMSGIPDSCTLSSWYDMYFSF